MFGLRQGCCKGANSLVVPNRSISMKGDVHLSNRRVMRKIKMGKARPAIFHQFETLVELSDGSVVKRRSQAPKDEIRMINDQRNSSFWNPNRSDLTSVDPNEAGKINKFRQKFSTFEHQEPEKGTTVTEDDETSAVNDDMIALLGENAEEVQKGGKLSDKKSNRKK